jgi:hypothetical protein
VDTSFGFRSAGGVFKKLTARELLESLDPTVIGIWTIPELVRELEAHPPCDDYRCARPKPKLKSELVQCVRLKRIRVNSAKLVRAIEKKGTSACDRSLADCERDEELFRVRDAAIDMLVEDGWSEIAEGWKDLERIDAATSADEIERITFGTPCSSQPT